MEIGSSEFGNQNSKFDFRDSECDVRSLRFGIRRAGCDSARSAVKRARREFSIYACASQDAPSYATLCRETRALHVLADRDVSKSSIRLSKTMFVASIDNDDTDISEVKSVLRTAQLTGRCRGMVGIRRVQAKRRPGQRFGQQG